MRISQTEDYNKLSSRQRRAIQLSILIHRCAMLEQAMFSRRFNPSYGRRLRVSRKELMLHTPEPRLRTDDTEENHFPAA